MKSTKVQTLAEFDANIGIFGLKTLLHAYVLGEHTSVKMSCSRQMLKVRGLSIESRSSIYIQFALIYREGGRERKRYIGRKQGREGGREGKEEVYREKVREGGREGGKGGGI